MTPPRCDTMSSCYYGSTSMPNFGTSCCMNISCQPRTQSWKAGYCCVLGECDASYQLWTLRRHLPTLVQFGRFHRGMLERGVYLAPSQYEAGFTGLKHTEEDIDATIAAARDVLRSL